MLCKGTKRKKKPSRFKKKIFFWVPVHKFSSAMIILFIIELQYCILFAIITIANFPIQARPFFYSTMRESEIDLKKGVGLFYLSKLKNTDMKKHFTSKLRFQILLTVSVNDIDSLHSQV